MLNIPTINNPLKVIVPGHPIGMKNNYVPFVRKDGSPGLRKSQKAKKYLHEVTAAVMQRVTELDIGITDDRICVWFEAFFFASHEDMITQSDADNAYTTFQECLQDLLVLDDKQVTHHNASKYTVVSRAAERTEAYIWLDTRDHPAEQYLELYKFTRQEKGLEVPQEVILLAKELFE